MKSPKPMVDEPLARRLRASIMAGLGDDSVEGFIYKEQRMTTLPVMFKRILILTAAAVMGFAAGILSMRVAGSWTLFPNRDLDKSSSYIRDVLKTVNENYV